MDWEFFMFCGTVFDHFAYKDKKISIIDLCVVYFYDCYWNYHFLLRNFRLKFMSVTLMFGRLDNRFEDFGTEFRLGRAWFISVCTLLFGGPFLIFEHKLKLKVSYWLSFKEIDYIYRKK